MSVLEELSAKEDMFFPTSYPFFKPGTFNEPKHYSYRRIKLNGGFYGGYLTIVYFKIKKESIKTKNEKRISKTEGGELQASTTISEFFQTFYQDEDVRALYTQRFGRATVETVKSATQIDSYNDFDTSFNDDDGTVETGEEWTLKELIDLKGTGWNLSDLVLEKENMPLLDWAREKLGSAKVFVDEVKKNELIVSVELPYAFIVNADGTSDNTFWELVCDNINIGGETGADEKKILVNFEGNIAIAESLIEDYGDEGKSYLQDENKFIKTDTKINGVKLSKYLADNIISDWKNGLETAKILCSIGEYYDENDELKISTVDKNKNMYFANNDKVIPYYRVENREVPISLYRDGTPKVFKVTSVNFIFDGAMWQELELVEVPK